MPAPQDERLAELLVAAKRVIFDGGRRRKRESLLRVIRRKCMDCMCGQRSMIRTCPSRNCPLWPYRSGMLPETARERGWDVDVEGELEEARS